MSYPGMPGMEEDGGGKRPRGKMTPYACFVKVIRAEHKKKHPREKIVFAEFSKKCAEKWRQMTDKEKRRFQEMSEKDKERFNKEMSYYSTSANMSQMNMGGGGGKMPGKGRKRKRPKDPNAPKRALSAFMWFCKAERPNVKGANPKLNMGQIAKVLSEQWKCCQNKHIYESQADNDKERYKEAMKIYKANKQAMTVAAAAAAVAVPEKRPKIDAAEAHSSSSSSSSSSSEDEESD